MRDPDSTSYVGTMGDCRASGAHLRAEAIRRGLALARIIIFLGDGAAWIWENARLFFPTAIQILDFYHAVEHLGVLARALFGDGEFGSAQQSLWASQLKQSGMFWGEAGAENILQLRCLLKSPHFDAAWQARRPILAARQAKARRWSKAS